MSEPFIGEIRIFAGEFAPRGWAFCDGQLLPIAQNTALFSIIGTTYGGDGRSTMALPNLQGRVPMHPGRGPGLTSRLLGQQGGVTQVALTEAQIPSHTHPLNSAATGNAAARPNGNVPGSAVEPAYATTPAVGMAPTAAAGGAQPHNNMQPYLTLNYIIALVGLYPSRD